MKFAGKKQRKKSNLEKKKYKVNGGFLGRVIFVKHKNKTNKINKITLLHLNSFNNR